MQTLFLLLLLFFQIVLCPQIVSLSSSIIRGHHAQIFSPEAKLAFCHFCFAIANRFLGSFTVAKGICDWQISPVSILPFPLSAPHILGTAQAEHRASTVPILLWRNSTNSSIPNNAANKESIGAALPLSSACYITGRLTLPSMIIIIIFCAASHSQKLHLR